LRAQRIPRMGCLSEYLLELLRTPFERSSQIFPFPKMGE
jgi:hypothetical protein